MILNGGISPNADFALLFVHERAENPVSSINNMPHIFLFIVVK
jgi:hypothetical protein